MLVNASGWTSLLTFFVISLAWLVGFSSRLFSVIRFESIIHEFDPWFNYRSTHYMVENGFYNFLNWFDDRAWYPLGRIVGGTVYPGLMITSGKWLYMLKFLYGEIIFRIYSFSIYFVYVDSAIIQLVQALLGIMPTLKQLLFILIYLPIFYFYIERSRKLKLYLRTFYYFTQAYATLI